MPVLRSGPLAAWTRAWIAGRVSLDQVVDAVTGRDAPHLVLDATGVLGAASMADATLTLHDVLVAWRRLGAPVLVALPVPGDVRGVPGPSELRATALEAGEVAFAAGLALVPEVMEHAPSSAPPTVHWHAAACEQPPPDPLSLTDAAYELDAAVRESATALSNAGVAGSSSRATELLGDARRAGERPNLPPGTAGPVVALLAQAQRLQAVLDLTAADPIGGAIDRYGIAARADALRPLATAVRRARVAAYNA